MRIYFNIKTVKEDLLDLIFYEIKMLKISYFLIHKNQDELNLKLECFLLHARNLVNFLICDKHLSVSDFKDNKGLSIKEISVYNSKKLLKTINISLSHLSTGRINKPNWKMNEIYEEIKVKFLLFLNQLNDSYFEESKIKKEDFLKYLSDD